MTSDQQWPRKGGEAGSLIRSFDWSSTFLGPLEDWPPSLRSTVDTLVNSPIAQVLMWGPDHVMVYNDGYIAIAGGNHPKALGVGVASIWPEIWDWNQRVLAACLRGEVQSFREQPLTLNRNGFAEEATFDLFYTPVHLETGEVGGVLCTILENTDKVKAQRELARREAELRMITDAMPILVAFIDRNEIYRFANSHFRESMGVDPASIIGRHARVILGDEAYLTRKPLLARAMLGETIVTDAWIPRGDGTDYFAEIRYIPRLAADGSVEGLHVLAFDVDERKRNEDQLRRHATELEHNVRQRTRAEEQLRTLNENLESRVAAAVAERRKVEIALAQALRMETIGKLTGGIAHDFNNLLQVVSGNLQLLTQDIAGNQSAERRVQNALAGVDRGARLAGQLLAFGRRQPLAPKVVNVARLVRDMDELLRRAIGESVEIETIAGGGLWNTLIDPNQVENALLNLAINARDAMDGEGRLTIELGNVSLDDDYARAHAEVVAGQYVMLAVTDTGCGMAPDIADRVFDPFFSTKAEGGGSGLGLSMVYGFVKQSGGHIKIYSEPGHGTTVRLYLPRALAGEDIEVKLPLEPVVGGVETVLVVEDDEEVRETVVEMLGELGYRVLKAVDARSGLSVVESGIPIDLLFTDVVMPGTLKSPELARRARERLPDIAVLFTSGYTENAIVHGGRLDVGVELLSKPYSREALARKVRHVLSSQGRRPSVPSREGSPATTTERPSPESRSILLVEDDALIRMNSSDILSDAGHVVVEAADAEEAIIALGNAPIDILVTDVNLPGISGLQLAEKARQLRPGIAVVFATGDVAVEGTGDAVLLLKPYSAADLEAAVSRSVAVVAARRALA